ncbi:hypothetical protein A3D03_06150 [Candidatus Gottesmanbacteria bacterium RIFCSPHIGHO2_02_FULL_40_13]|uniref:DNA polymerase III subunit delta n=1 Tax=Candidatus Gottesmanbacteria bacterium RIFCSPHIGHO2_02_FULL_40_13 TaxID=1798384 RepID=A0A1F6A7S5_9BACT|nr:MAG: hypothetical protein A3D03_06150 [Candidatus Gottesmanbacteria bacterium RIFCSPHIGHO2_02_FULL_40_13]
MQPILFLSDDQTNINNYIESQKKFYHTSPFTTYEIFPSPSIGIDQVREIKNKLRFKSYQKIINLIIINDIHKATAEAQNSLLKLLEEPPPDTLFLLTSANVELILETVVSRCKIEKDTTVHKDIRSDETTFVLLRQILQSSPGKRLLISQKITGKKEESLKFLDSLLTVMKNIMLNPHQDIGLTMEQISNMITKSLNARSYLEKNINPKATLDILFLSFPKI